MFIAESKEPKTIPFDPPVQTIGSDGKYAEIRKVTIDEPLYGNPRVTVEKFTGGAIEQHSESGATRLDALFAALGKDMPAGIKNWTYSNGFGQASAVCRVVDTLDATPYANPFTGEAPVSYNSDTVEAQMKAHVHAHTAAIQEAFGPRVLQFATRRHAA